MSKLIGNAVPPLLAYHLAMNIKNLLNVINYNVLLECLFYDKKTKLEFMVELRIEIRWSHGKFCGNPEAKIYKQWSYNSLPWAVNLC